MIKAYFGVPGCGKSTILVREYKKNKRIGNIKKIKEDMIIFIQ